MWRALLNANVLHAVLTHISQHLYNVAHLWQIIYNALSFPKFSIIFTPRPGSHSRSYINTNVYRVTFNWPSTFEMNKAKRQRAHMSKIIFAFRTRCADVIIFGACALHLCAVCGKLPLVTIWVAILYRRNLFSNKRNEKNWKNERHYFHIEFKTFGEF